jgi:hypothetical protein
VQKLADALLFVLLLAFLAWVPMPFGSASDAAQPPLIIPPLLLCCAAVLLRANRQQPLVTMRPARIWITGGVLFVAVISLQLVPLPMALLHLISPRSAAIWGSADRLAAMADVATPALHPVTIDPAHTALHLYRALAFLATFLSAMLLVRDNSRRLIFALLLATLGAFEALYAMREAALGRFAIWGWKNTLIFGRPTGTFVNPNHFAHYGAIVLPMALFLCAYAWHTAAPAGAKFGRRLVKLVEQRFLLFVYGLLTALACLTAVLISQSRGAALALIGGFAVAGALANGKRHPVARAGMIAVVVCAAMAVAFLLLGHSETISRFNAVQTANLGGRSVSIIGAFKIWQMFPLLGSGAGTYADVVLMTRATSVYLLTNHAHADYAEILATTGALGFLVSLVSLLAGFAALTQQTFGADSEALSWRRRAFQTAALTSLAVAMIHALVDFNFFIPANPVTLVAILGAAVAAREW